MRPTRLKFLALCGIFLAPTIALGDAAVKRFPQLTLPDVTEAQRPVASAIMTVSGIGIQGPYNVLLRSPDMAQRMVSLMNYLRFGTSVPRELNEFAILVEARLWTSQVEWGTHYPVAIKAGLSESVAADLRAGRRPAGMKPEETVVYDLCTELAATHQLSDATFNRAKAVFNDQQIADLIVVAGTYVTLAMVMATGQEEMPDGSVPLQVLPVASSSMAGH